MQTTRRGFLASSFSPDPALDGLLDGNRDATEILNALARSIVPGGVLRLPPGRFRVTAPVMLNTGSCLTGPGATIFSVSGSSHPLVTNVGHAAPQIQDIDITVEDIDFAYVDKKSAGCHAIKFRKVRGVSVRHCGFSGGDNATAFLACENTEVADCHAVGTLNCGYDHWEGSSDCLVQRCEVTCREGYGILFTGVGTESSDDEQASRLIAIDNIVRAPTQAGIWACSLSRHSSVSAIKVHRNRIYGGQAVAHGGIGGTGAVIDLDIKGNVLTGLHGGAALFTRPDEWNRPRKIRVVGNYMVDCLADEDGALMQILGDDIEVTGNRAVDCRYPELLSYDAQQVLVHDNR